MRKGERRKVKMRKKGIAHIVDATLVNEVEDKQ